MENIELLVEMHLTEGCTTKYWRKLACGPQVAKLCTWDGSHPWFTLNGIVIESHDKRELGTTREVCYQTYSFALKKHIENGSFKII